jgi:hypothetical protein
VTCFSKKTINANRCVRLIQAPFVDVLTGEGKLYGYFMLDITAHTENFSLFGQRLTARSLRLPAADSAWNPYDYCLRGTLKIVSVNNPHSLQ